MIFTKTMVINALINTLDTKRSQHYEWLIPVYYKNPDKEDTDVKVLYLEARTTTVKRTLVPNVESLEYGEIPVAFRKVLKLF